MADAKGVRRVHLKRSPRRRLQIAGRAIGLFEVGQDLAGALVIAAPDLGQAEAARRAVQQPRPQPCLERLHVLAHHRRRQAEIARRAGKALGVHDLDEHREGGEPIHRPIRIFHRK
jgi:hypothetical protein